MEAFVLNSTFGKNLSTELSIQDVEWMYLALKAKAADFRCQAVDHMLTNVDKFDDLYMTADKLDELGDKLNNLIR